MAGQTEWKIEFYGDQMEPLDIEPVLAQSLNGSLLAAKVKLAGMNVARRLWLRSFCRHTADGDWERCESYSHNAA